jgi:hypothetical protein
MSNKMKPKIFRISQISFLSPSPQADLQHAEKEA